MDPKVSHPLSNPASPPSSLQAMWARRQARQRATLADLRSRIKVLEAARLKDRQAHDRLVRDLTNLFSAFVSGWISGCRSPEPLEKARN